MRALAARDLQDYQSQYIDLYDKYRRKDSGVKENINDDILFEIGLIKQVEVNIDYILMLVEKYHNGNCEDQESLSIIRKSVDVSIQLRSKKELIEQFISPINVNSSIQSDWRWYALEQEESDLAEIIAMEKLKPEETLKFMENVFHDGVIKTTSTDIDKLMPPISSLDGGNCAKKKQGIIEKFTAFFEKYFGLNVADAIDSWLYITSEWDICRQRIELV